MLQYPKRKLKLWPLKERDRWRIIIDTQTLLWEVIDFNFPCNIISYNRKIY